MTDIIVNFMEHLRSEWSDISVMSGHQAKGQRNVIGVDIQRWIQRPEGCEVTLNVTYYPDVISPMQSMLKWLNEFHALIQTTEPRDVFTQWWGQTAQFSTDPLLNVNCSVLLRYDREVV